MTIMLLIYFLTQFLQIYSQEFFRFYIQGRLNSMSINGVDITTSAGLDTTSTDITHEVLNPIIKGDVIKIVFEKIDRQTGFAAHSLTESIGKSTNTTDLWTLNCTTPIEYYTDAYLIHLINSLLIGTTSDNFGEYIEVTYTAPSALFCLNFDEVSSPGQKKDIDFYYQFLTLNGEAKTNVKFIIKNDPLFGSFEDPNGLPIQKKTYTSVDLIASYVPTTYGKLETILYNGKSDIGLSFEQCKFTIYACYESCDTCVYEKADADAINHLCTTCKTGYYSLEDNSKSCYEGSSDVPGYILDGGNFKKCYDSCESCSGVGTGNDHLCLTCLPYYYYLENDSKMNCYNSPPNGYYYNPAVPNYSLCHPSCLTCSGRDSDPLITTCNIKSCAANFFFLEDDETQCVDICPIGYISNGVDECNLCYQSCKTCSNPGDISNHNCLTCKPSLGLVGTNCETCLDNWYNDNLGHMVCVSTCPATHPLLIVSTKECINTSCLSQSLVELDSTCIPNCPSTHHELYGKCILNTTPPPPSNTDDDIIINETLKDFIDDFENNFEDYFNQGKDIVGDDFIIEIVNDTKNNTSKENSSSIDLLECETILRRVYEIPPNDPLILVKIDILTGRYHTNQIEYAVYDKNFVKLDLRHCEGVDIIINSPIKNDTGLDLVRGKEMRNKGIDIYNGNDPVFNDICYPYQENNTDIIINDRRNYIYINASFCDENCTYLNINYTSLMVQCSCNTKTKVSPIESDIKSPSVFTESIASINLAIFKCYQLIPHWDHLVSNGGFWLIGSFVFIQLICILAYSISGINRIFSHLNKYPLPYKGSNPPSKKRSSLITILDDIIEEDLGTSQKKPIDIDSKYQKKRNSIVIAENYAPTRITRNIHNNVIENKSKENTEEDSSFDIDIEAPKVRRGSVILKTVNSKAKKKENNDDVISISPRNKNRKRRKSQFDEVCPISKKHYTIKHNTEEILNLKNNSYYCDTKHDIMTPQNKTNETRPSFKQGNYNHKYRKSQPSIIINKNIYINSVGNSIHSRGSISDIESNLQFSPVKRQKRMSALMTQVNLETTSISSNTPQLTSSNLLKTKVIKDLDNCPFTLALRADKRNCCQIYWDFLKDIQLILRTFVRKSEFELISINLTVLVFGLAMDFTLNALFYTDDIISERYHSKGELSFLSTILKSIYSSLLSFFFVGIINCLSGYAYKLDLLVNEFKNQLVFDQVCDKVVKSLRCKLNTFFIIESIFLLCFWYYCTVFCIVYRQSQMSWLEGCLNSFIMSIGTTMILCLIITIFRVCSFQSNSKNMYYTARYLSKKI